MFHSVYDANSSPARFVSVMRNVDQGDKKSWGRVCVWCSFKIITKFQKNENCCWSTSWLHRIYYGLFKLIVNLDTRASGLFDIGKATMRRCLTWERGCEVKFIQTNFNWLITFTHHITSNREPVVKSQWSEAYRTESRLTQ